MADLLASLDGKTLSVNRGDQVRGKVVTVTPNEIYVDLGTKAEGYIAKRDLLGEYEDVKPGDTLEAYVLMPENESGQIVLTLDPNLGRKSSYNSPVRNWTKFITAMNQHKKIHGKVTEMNKGGVVVEADGVRGFLPSSQISFEHLTAINDLIGQDIALYVIEIDQNNNRLIFSDREEPSQDIQNQLSKFQSGQQVTGKIVAVLNFGIFVDIEGVEGVVFVQEASWDKVEDLTKLFNVGDQITALVNAVDTNMGRLNLSLKKLTQDPFAQIVEKYQPDDVVKATVKELVDGNVLFQLTDGVEAVMDKSKVDSTSTYQPGQLVTVLVDSVDARNRKVNVAPMLTSTSGLIYK